MSLFLPDEGTEGVVTAAASGSPPVVGNGAADLSHIVQSLSAPNGTTPSNKTIPERLDV